MSIETDKDSFLIYVLPLYDEEGVVCCFNGLNYLIDKDNGEKLFGITDSTSTVPETGGV